jgi:hypothetical protein
MGLTESAATSNTHRRYVLTWVLMAAALTTLVVLVVLFAQESAHKSESFSKACDHLTAARFASAHGDVATANDEAVKADSWSEAAIEDSTGGEHERAMTFAVAMHDAIPYLGGQRATSDMSRALDACEE